MAAFAAPAGAKSALVSAVVIAVLWASRNFGKALAGMGREPG